MYFLSYVHLFLITKYRKYVSNTQRQRNKIKYLSCENYRRKWNKEGGASGVLKERTKLNVSDVLESGFQFGYMVVIFKAFCLLKRHWNDNFVGCREVSLVSVKNSPSNIIPHWR